MHIFEGKEMKTHFRVGYSAVGRLLSLVLHACRVRATGRRCCCSYWAVTGCGLHLVLVDYSCHLPEGV